MKSAQILTPASDTDAFRARLTGDLLTPDAFGYDATRALWNGMIDKRPAFILR